MKKIQKMSRGITLIALVVTIIVLLLLAGISVQMLTGNNGILQKTGQARDLTEENQIIEEARIDILSTFATKKIDSLSENELRDILDPKYGTVSRTEGKNIKEEMLTTTDGKYVIPVFKIYNGALTTVPTIAEADEKEYYGQFIDYDVDLDDNTDDDDWKILYNDGKNIYIIAEDYVPMSKCSYVTNATTGRTENSRYMYSLYWDDSRVISNFKSGSMDIFGNDTSVSNATRYIASKYLSEWKNALGDEPNTNINAKMMALLMDTNLWRNFANSEKVKALSNLEDDELAAIGGPPIEMWVKSWNKKYCSESNDAKINYSANATGYTIGFEANSETINHKEIADSLYCPHKSEIDNYCDGFWIASPAGDSATDRVLLIDIFFPELIGTCSLGYYYYSVRPVVCLPSDITAIWNEEDNVWNITKK